MKRITDKISQIVEFLDQLNEIAPPDINQYKSNIEKKAACERYVEKIVEAVVDLAFLTIKNKKLRLPQDDIDAFTILSDEKIISKELAARLKDAKGMRNILSHQYGSIDDEIVFEAITEQIDKEVRELIDSLKKAE